MLEDDIQSQSEYLSVINFWNRQIDAAGRDVIKVAHYYPDEYVALIQRNLELTRGLKRLKDIEVKYNLKMAECYKLQCEVERAQRILRDNDIRVELRW